MSKYEVIVSNVGTVYSGDDSVRAGKDYNECMQLSKDNYGRFAGESVMFMVDGSPFIEYIGTNEQG